MTLLCRSLVHSLVAHHWSIIFPVQLWQAFVVVFERGWDMCHLSCYRSPIQNDLSGLSLKISDLVLEFKTQTSFRPGFFGNSVFYTGEGGILGNSDVSAKTISHRDTGNIQPTIRDSNVPQLWAWCAILLPLWIRMNPTRQKLVLLSHSIWNTLYHI